MKRVLMVAFHFPPFSGSSGVQRTLRFVQHLREFNWEPVVLTAQAHAYERTSEDLLAEVPLGAVVERAFALDTAKHLSIAGRYPAMLARPDRWTTWRVRAIPAGLRLVRRLRPHVIWSTYPIATAHVIGAALCRKTNLPWIADFRDPMAQDGYPSDPLVWQSFKHIEEQAVRRAHYSVFTTPSAVRMYQDRYPDHAERITLLENGFDEDSFAAIPLNGTHPEPLVPGALTLLHSGVVYPSERDPTQLFAALQRLAVSGKLSADRLRVRFRAAVHEDMLRSLARAYGVERYVEVLPGIPYRAALEEMLRADGLLVLQAQNCNEQIPAKIYEYLRARRPILGLTDPRGDTASVLQDAGLDMIARLDSTEEIAAILPRFIDAIQTHRASLPNTDYIARSSRRSRTEALAGLLNRVCAAR